MAINFTTLKTALYDWVSENIPALTPVIWLNQNSPRPDKPYITIFMTSFVQIGDDYTPKSDNAGIAQTVGDREFTLQIQAIGNNSMQVLENLRTSLQNDNVLATLAADNIAFVLQNPITDLSQLLDTEWEERASMDILFRVAQVIDPDLGAIEIAEIEETLSNGESVVYNETLTIDAS